MPHSRSSGPDDDRRVREPGRALSLVLFLALALRLGLLLAVPRYGHLLSVGIPHVAPIGAPGVMRYLDRRTDNRWLTEDEHCYDEMAQGALRGEGFVTKGGWMVAPPGKPTSYGGFTYPAFLTAIYAVAGGPHQLPVFLVQILLGTASALAVFALARRFTGAIGGLLAAGLYALSPGIAWSSLALMSEGVFVPLVAIALWRVQVAWDRDRRWDWALAGFLLAIAALARSTVLYFLAVVALGLLLRDGIRFRSVSRILALAAAFFVTVAPWTYRNWRVHGAFLLLDSKAGTNLYQYNNANLVPEIGIRAAAGAPPSPITPEVTVQNGGNEVAQDRRYAALFREYVISQPGHFASVVAARAVFAISPLPVTNRTPLNVAVALLVRGPVLVLAIVGWLTLRRRWRESFVLLALPLYWWALQALSGPGLRYRLPVEFAYAVLAAAGAIALWSRLQQRRARLDGPAS